MSRVATKIELSPEETDELNRWIKSGKTEQRKVERAKIVLRSAEGKADASNCQGTRDAADQGQQMAQAFRSAEGSGVGG